MRSIKSFECQENMLHSLPIVDFKHPLGLSNKVISHRVGNASSASIQQLQQIFLRIVAFAKIANEHNVQQEGADHKQLQVLIEILILQLALRHIFQNQFYEMRLQVVPVVVIAGDD